MASKLFNLDNPYISVYAFRGNANKVGSIELIKYDTEIYDSVEIIFPDVNTIETWIGHLKWLKEIYQKDIELEVGEK